MWIFAVTVSICFSLATAQRGSIHQIDEDVYFVGDSAVTHQGAVEECHKCNQGKLYNLSTPQNLTFAWKITNSPLYDYTCTASLEKTSRAETEGYFHVAGKSGGNCSAFNRNNRTTNLIDCKTEAFFICKCKDLTNSGAVGKTWFGRSSCSKWKLVNIEISQCCQFQWLNHNITQNRDYNFSLIAVQNKECLVTYNVSRLGHKIWNEHSFSFSWKNITKRGLNASCPANSTCKNFQCNCNTGFKSKGNYCTDVNECETNTHKCHPNATCANIMGSYTCTCNDGFVGNGTKCKNFSVLRSICGTNQTQCEEKLYETFSAAIISTKEVLAKTILLNKITTNQALSINVTKIIAKYMSDVSKAASIGNIRVTSGILASMLSTTSNILEVKSINLLELERKQTIVRAISAFALQAQLSPANDAFIFATKCISIKVQNLYSDRKDPVVYKPHLIGMSNTTKLPTIIIPASAIRKAAQKIKPPNAVRAVFIFYNKSTLFYSDHPVKSAISAELGDGSRIENLADPVRIQHLGETTRNEEKRPSGDPFKALKTTFECVYWNFTQSEWSTKGCCLDPTSHPPECRCNHLTNFALLVNSKLVPGDVALSIVSDVGCILSIIGLGVTVVVHCLHREVRRRRPAKILINICCNLLVVYFIFVSGVSRADAGHACTLVAVLLHYFMLTTWCWMAVYSYDMYMSVVKVFREDSGGFLQRVSAFSYCTPLLIVGSTLAITLGYFDHQHQTDAKFCFRGDANEFYSTYRAENMCWLTGYSLNFAFLLPVGILFLFNLGAFAIVFREISCKSNETQTSSMKRSNQQMFLIASTMSAVMGVTWIFGYLMLISDDKIYFSIMSWLFAIFNTLQGVVIFTLTSVRSDELRKVWWSPIRSAVSRGFSTQ